MNKLNVSLELVNDKLHFIGASNGKEKVSIDYTPPLGDNLGHTSLELLLLSLSSCIGSTFLVVLRRQRKIIRGLKVKASGTRKETPPTGFEAITIELLFTADDLSEEDLESAREIVVGICPVWSMIKGNTELELKYEICCNGN